MEEDYGLLTMAIDERVLSPVNGRGFDGFN